MKFIRNALIALSLLVTPVAFAQETPTVCETKEKVMAAVASTSVSNNLDIKTAEFTGVQAKAFIDAVTETVGPPPVPVSSVLLFVSNQVVMLVFFGDDGCAKFMIRTSPENLTTLLREASL
jgi:hypothetical protein